MYQPQGLSKDNLEVGNSQELSKECEKRLRLGAIYSSHLVIRYVCYHRVPIYLTYNCAGTRMQVIDERKLLALQKYFFNLPTWQFFRPTKINFGILALNCQTQNRKWKCFQYYCVFLNETII